MRFAWLVALSALPLGAQSAANVLLIVNQTDSLSRRVGDYYVHRRSLPLANVCRIRTAPVETVSRDVYDQEIERPVGACLARGKLRESILYLVTTAGVPLRITGPGSGPATEACAVDSELALLYAKMRGARFPRAGVVPNPFFGHKDERFSHPQFPMYLVTRLAGYDFTAIQGMIDRALAARNRGKFVIDLSAGNAGPGDEWLRSAAMFLPKERVIFDDTATVLYGQQDVIGYASWGSNDRNRKRRFLGFRWLPGAIVTEFVSTNGRTFQRPPEQWTISTWSTTDRPRWFAGSPQSLTADYLYEGATGCSGHVYEPYLAQTPRPEYLLPAYYKGSNLAESYYLAITSLSWQNIVVGDPLCSLGKP